MYLTHQLLEQHSDSLKFGQPLYWIYTEGKSLIMKLGRGLFVLNVCEEYKKNYMLVILK